MIRRRSSRLFLFALLVRLIHLAQIRSGPTFDVPLVDGANYFRTASAIASGDLPGGSQAFWQPPLYPYFLALLLRIFGPNMMAIYVVQAAIGALSCLLVYLLGRRLFDERSGLAASIIMALYGPLIHFDAQPLIPVLHIVLLLGGLLFIVRAAGIPEAAHSPDRDWGIAGLLWGLAVVATPNLLLAVPPVAVWSLKRARRPAALLLFLLGVGLPIAAVTARNLAVSGEAVLISSNGGINFYIGNNPDYDRTIRIRPGGEFERLASEPENLGILGAGARSRYFVGRARDFLAGYPGAALRLYLRKGLDLAAGREIPRNQDQYAARGDSSLLALLLWRHGVAFPFGLVAPLALAGACAGARPCPSGRSLLLLLASSYALSILLFFPTDRYRLPLVPIAALFAGACFGAPPRTWRRPAFLVLLLAGLVLFNLDALRAGESYPEEEALNRAYALRMQGRLADARTEYRRALAIRPGRIDAYNALASMAAQEGKWAEAADLYRELLDLAPDFVEVHHSLGQAYLALGRKEEARSEWRIAAGLAPGAGPALADLCVSYLDEAALGIAEPFCRQAAAARPDLAETHFALGLYARATRDRNGARAELTEAARLFPRGSPGRRKAEEMLEKMRRRDEMR